MAAVMPRERVALPGLADIVNGIKGSFLFTSLRAHQRFLALLHRMNLTGTESG